MATEIPTPSSSDDAVMAQWRAIYARVTEAADQATKDPEFAAARGWRITVHRVPDTSMLVRSDAVPESPYTIFLRAAAAEFIPTEFEWEIMPTVGGQAYLVLKGHKPAAHAIPSA